MKRREGGEQSKENNKRRRRRGGGGRMEAEMDQEPSARGLGFSELDMQDCALYIIV